MPPLKTSKSTFFSYLMSHALDNITYLLLIGCEQIVEKSLLTLFHYSDLNKEQLNAVDKVSVCVASRGILCLVLSSPCVKKPPFLSTRPPITPAHILPQYCSTPRVISFHLDLRFASSLSFSSHQHAISISLLYHACYMFLDKIRIQIKTRKS
jgi:hypothetical protein